MRRLAEKKGFTLLEMMMVLAIAAIIGSVAFLGAVKNQKRLRQAGCDGIAKELFVAAQNHLSMAYSQNYPGITESSFGASGAPYGGTYFVAGGGNGSTDPDDTGKALNLMLPFASIDEAVRKRGSYLIRFNKDTGHVLDVFYSESEGKYSHKFVTGEYISLMDGYRGGEHSADRLDYEGAVIGYYGESEAVSVPQGAYLEAPSAEVVNGDRLMVNVTDPNAFGTLKLVITGMTSQKSCSFDVPHTYAGAVHTVVIDDLRLPGKQFRALAPGLYPGEDLMIQAVAYDNESFTNVAKSGITETNSLFASLSPDGASAEIRSIRHIENLDGGISGLDAESGRFPVTEAYQTSDISFETYCLDYSSDKYMPVTPYGSLSYDGKGHRVEKVKISTDGNGGLFASLHDGSSVRDLELIDFGIEASGSAGALAGTASGTAVSGVLVRNMNRSASAEDERLDISGADSAGGLIGTVTGGSVTDSAASVYVKSENGAAGGLIGFASGSSVSYSYSGGHTKNGSYADISTGAGRYNVTGRTYIGGLIGYAGDGAEIINCYSTCSAHTDSEGVTPGALIGVDGYASDGCYSTGRVTGAGFASDNAECISMLLPAESRLTAVTYDTVLVAGADAKFSFPTVSQLAPGHTIKAGISDRHYGDWPQNVGGVYVINYFDEGGAAFSGIHEDGYPMTHIFGADTALKAASKAGCEFEGWFTDPGCSGTAVTVLGASAYTEAVNLYAKWRSREIEIIYYDGNGESFGGTPSPSPSVHIYGTDTVLSGHHSKTGYTFGGWFAESGCSGSSISVLGGTDYAAGPIYLYAKWEANEYAIRYYDGLSELTGESIAGCPAAYVYDITTEDLGEAQKTGYVFKGWYFDQSLSGEQVTRLTKETYTAPISLYAKWEPDRYSINYHDQGSGGILTCDNAGELTISHIYGTTTELRPAERAGYEFGGWYRDIDCSGAAITALGSGEIPETVSFELYAKWNRIWNIVYKDGGGGIFTGTHDTGHPLTHTFGTETELLGAYKEGYVFRGWFVNSGCGGSAVTSISAGTNTNIMLYAKWEAIPSGSLVLSAAAEGYSAVFVVQKNRKQLPKDTDGRNYLAPARTDGYILEGWYSSMSPTAHKVLNPDGTIAAEVQNYTLEYKDALVFDVNGTRYLYAKWTKDAVYQYVGDGAYVGTAEDFLMVSKKEGGSDAYALASVSSPSGLGVTSVGVNIHEGFDPDTGSNVYYVLENNFDGSGTAVSGNMIWSVYRRWTRVFDYIYSKEVDKYLAADGASALTFKNSRSVFNGSNWECQSDQTYRSDIFGTRRYYIYIGAGSASVRSSQTKTYIFMKQAASVRWN